MSSDIRSEILFYGDSTRLKIKNIKTYEENIWDREIIRIK